MTRNDRSWKLGLASFLVMGGAIASYGESALAQITPDTTLGNENSTVTSTGSVDSINGGAIRGANLFHSFGEFNIDEGRAAVFTNPAGIENILTRVTGANPSNILGTLGVAGNANLFLMNPKGIIFGPNARLDIGGSFVGTTANAIAFGERGFFSATDKNIPSQLLTINPSALLFNQINQNATIQNNSVTPAGKDPAGFNAFGLRVPDGKSLLLVGGNLSMDGGQLNAYGGRVELGGLVEAGNVLLGVDGNNLSLKFPSNVARADVSLTNQAAIYVEGAANGSIAINARNLEILGGTVLSAGIGRGLGIPENVAGDITLDATGEIKIASGSGVGNNVRLGSQGKGGNITVNSGSFSLLDGSLFQASTIGRGNAGNVTVRAKDAVFIADADIFSRVEAGGVGKGGNIDINAASLSLTDSAQLVTATREASDSQPAGRGDAGNVNVKVTGAVDIAGEKNGFGSGINSLVETGTVGNGGNITIDSGSFSLLDDAQLSASTSEQGNAGTIQVNAADFANISGTNSISNTGLFVNSQSPTGTAGDLIVTSPKVTISNSGRVNAESTSGNGGNINLNVRDLLLLRRGAQISTTAGTAEAGGNGGNININARNGFIVAVPRENSDITANAFSGSGGRVTINAAGIFGIAVNPSSGLVNFPTVPVDTQVAQACTPGSSQDGSEFVVTGRGGLPPTPNEALNPDAIAIDWVTLQPQSDRKYNTATSTRLTTLEPKPIVEAQGWIINKNGKVVLTASAPTATPHSSWQTQANCSS